MRLARWLLSLWLCFWAVACTPSPPATPSAQALPVSSPGPASSEEESNFTRLRLQMVEQTIEARSISDPDVLRAMRTVRRHLFVPDL